MLCIFQICVQLSFSLGVINLLPVFYIMIVFPFHFVLFFFLFFWTSQFKGFWVLPSISA